MCYDCTLIAVRIATESIPDKNMDPRGIEPLAFRMRSERDASTPRTQSMYQLETSYIYSMQYTYCIIKP